MLILFAFLHLSLVAIDLNLPLSAAQNGSNELIFPGKTTSVTAIQPAIIIPGIETGVTYLYSLKELPYYFFHSGFQYGKFGFYLANSHLAHDLYQENQTYLAGNYRYKNLSFGFQTRYLYNKVTDYNKFSKFLYDIGFAYSFQQYQFAFALKNITQTTFYGTDLPSFFLWEANYCINQNANLSFGIEKQNHFDFIYRIGGFYQILPFFSILTSYQYEPQRIGIGTVIKYDNWNIFYSIRTHQYLNLTHFISISYALSN